MNLQGLPRPPALAAAHARKSLGFDPGLCVSPKQVLLGRLEVGGVEVVNPAASRRTAAARNCVSTARASACCFAANRAFSKLRNFPRIASAAQTRRRACASNRSCKDAGELARAVSASTLAIVLSTSSSSVLPVFNKLPNSGSGRAVGALGDCSQIPSSASVKVPMTLPTSSVICAVALLVAYVPRTGHGYRCE